MTTLNADAAGFVLEHGNAYEKLYLCAALGRPANQSLVTELLALQNSDGGWPWSLVAGMSSSVVTTARTLELLVKTGLEPADHVAEDAACFLLARQREDGGWCENRELSDLIPSDMVWISTTHSMTYATGDAISSLVAAGHAGHPAIGKAAALLRRTQNDEGGWSPHIAPDAPGGTDIASMDVIVKALMLTGEGRNSAILKWAAEAVVGNWEDWKYPVSAASALNVLLRLGYPRSHSHVQALVEALVESQRADGGWSVTGVGPSDAGQTAYCVKQLLKCGVEPAP